MKTLLTILLTILLTTSAFTQSYFEYIEYDGYDAIFDNTPTQIIEFDDSIKIKIYSYYSIFNITLSAEDSDNEVTIVLSKHPTQDYSYGTIILPTCNEYYILSALQTSTGYDSDLEADGFYDDRLIQINCPEPPVITDSIVCSTTDLLLEINIDTILEIGEILYLDTISTFIDTTPNMLYLYYIDSVFIISEVTTSIVTDSVFLSTTNCTYYLSNGTDSTSSSNTTYTVQDIDYIYSDTTIFSHSFETYIEIEIPTKLNENVITDIKPYPNPCTNVLTITSSVKPLIYNSSNKLLNVHITKNDNTYVIDTSSLPSGMYIIKTNTTSKFIKI